MPRRLWHRHQPPTPAGLWLKAGLGGVVGIGGIALLGESLSMPLLLAPLGASSVLVFGVPHSPLSQPANVIGGHLLAAALSLALHALLPAAWWAPAVAVGAVVAATAAARVTHPPAGADPLVVFLGQPVPMDFVTATLGGALLLVATGWAVHRLPPRTVYPLPVAPLTEPPAE